MSEELAADYDRNLKIVMFGEAKGDAWRIQLRNANSYLKFDSDQWRAFLNMLGTINEEYWDLWIKGRK